MYGGVLMSYSFMKDSKNFNCTNKNNNVEFTYKTNSSLDSFKGFYEDWLKEKKYDLKKVKFLTALIYLNMAPLHEKVFGDLLFFKSKLLLQDFYD